MKRMLERFVSILTVVIILSVAGLFTRACVDSNIDNPSYGAAFTIWAIGLCRFGQDSFNGGCKFL